MRKKITKVKARSGDTNTTNLRILVTSGAAGLALALTAAMIFQV